MNQFITQGQLLLPNYADDDVDDGDHKQNNNENVISTVEDPEDMLVKVLDISISNLVEKTRPITGNDPKLVFSHLF